MVKGHPEIFSRRMQRWPTWAVALLAGLAVTGCATPKKFVAGLSVEGRPIHGEIYGRGDDVILIMGAIHGDEAACAPLVRSLGEHIRRHPAVLSGKQVVLIPVANPDGLERRTRHNANGIDLNRNFPAGNFKITQSHGEEPLSEPESQALKGVLEMYQPSRIVSIHQPYGCIDYDGPAEPLAHWMSRRSDLPVKRVGSRPGSFGSYAGETLSIPIITLELPETGQHPNKSEIWQRHGPSLLAAIDYAGDGAERATRAAR
jgi:hypothetical protein